MEDDVKDVKDVKQQSTENKNQPSVKACCLLLPTATLLQSGRAIGPEHH
jgi:hypothetical protein